MKRGLPVGDPLFMFYASNEPKSVHVRDPGDCRDNYEKLAERVFIVIRSLRVSVGETTEKGAKVQTA